MRRALRRLSAKLKCFVSEKLGLDDWIDLGGVKIRLPPGHLLPIYFQEHITYDRFLPVLVTNLDGPGTIVDVGANVGDTVASLIVSNKDLSFVCIEPDDIFYDYLIENIGRIRGGIKDAKIDSVKSLIGQTVKFATLSGGRGTKHMTPANEAGEQTVPLDEVLQRYAVEPVKLIKVDVDGYDWDVIRSGYGVITSFHPLLFFEVQTESVVQAENYLKVIEELRGLGYFNWYVFDNFGGYLLNTRETKNIEQLILYAVRQNAGRFTRTIYYYDILAVCDDSRELVDRSIEVYLKKFLKSACAGSALQAR